MHPIVIVLTLLALLLGVSPVAFAADRIDARVVWVDDGDTIDVRIADRVERVRYIGIDAPEVPHHGEGGSPGGPAAAEVNRALVAGKPVTLELDAEPRDKYGRLLAYVWVNGEMANLEMVQRGYAHTLTIPPNVRYARSFADAERGARAAGRGLWGGDDFATDASVSGLPLVHVPPASVTVIHRSRESRTPRVRIVAHHTHRSHASPAHRVTRAAQHRRGVAGRGG